MKRFLFWLRFRTRAPHDSSAMLAGFFALVIGLWIAHTHHALPELVGAAAGVAAMGGSPGYGGPPHTFLFDHWRPDSGAALVSGTSLTVTATTTTVQDLVINGTCVGCPVSTPTQLDPAIFTEGRVYSVGAATVLAADTFTGANTGNINGRTTTTGAKTWVTAVGTSTHALVGISSNKAINAGALANYANAIIDTGAVDGVVTMTVSNKGTGVSHQGILFRCDAAADCLWAGWYNGACYGIGHSTKGVGDGTVYANDGCVNSLTNGDVLSVSYSGNVINFYRNSVLYLTTTQSQNNAQTHAGLCTGGGSVTPQFDDWSVQTVAVPVGLVVQGSYSTSDVSKIILGENAPGIALYDKGAQLLTVGFPDAASDYLTLWDPNFPAQTVLTYFPIGGASGMSLKALDAAGGENGSINFDGSTGTITIAGTNVNTNELNIGTSSTLLYRYSYAATLDFPLHGPLNQSILTITGAGSAAGDHCKVTTNVSAMNGTVDCHVTGSGANNISIVETCVNGAAGTCDTLSQAYHVEVTNQ